MSHPKHKTRTFTHHAASAGLILLVEDGKVKEGHAYGGFAATVYFREVGKPGYVSVPVHGVRDFVSFDELLTSDPAPAEKGPLPEEPPTPAGDVTAEAAGVQIVPDPTAPGVVILTTPPAAPASAPVAVAEPAPVVEPTSVVVPAPIVAPSSPGPPLLSPTLRPPRLS